MLKLAAPLALAALFALSADAQTRAGGHDHRDGGSSSPAPSSSPQPEPPSAPGSSPDGPDTRGDSSRRQFCLRHPGDYWCKAGPPYVGVSK